MTTKAVLSSGAGNAPFATPTHAEIAAGIAQIETELSLVTSTPAGRTDVEDTEPWVLDHSDDEWDGSLSVGSSVFARRAHNVALLTVEDEVVLARSIEAGAFARERLTTGVELRRTERRRTESYLADAAHAGRVTRWSGQCVPARRRASASRASRGTAHRRPRSRARGRGRSARSIGQVALESGVSPAKMPNTVMAILWPKTSSHVPRWARGATASMANKPTNTR